ncbi:hypothetical protein JL720_3529 [Aureococcus anophagefferens]|nr:hypothetical protein JL720_3529 [Aureococcus anophagefferens]
MKIRWLDAVFRPARRVRFLVTVKSPLTHKGAEAAEAHKTAVKACERRRVTDRWAPWSLTPMAVKAVVERNAMTGKDEARLDGASPGSQTHKQATLE